MEIDQRRILENIKAHDRVYLKYDRAHGEIYNDIEQARLKEALGRAISAVRTGATVPTALDMGCGSGNLTRHLLDLGARVIAADVSPKFLELIRERFTERERCSTLRLNGTDLREVETNSLDLIATYSVLHHIPDYLHAVAEMARVVKPGGIIYIDHEVTNEYWEPGPIYREFLDRMAPRGVQTWRRFADPRRYFQRLRRLRAKVRAWANPRYTPEGDIHIWPDDHIEWHRIEEILATAGSEVVIKEDYLLFVKGYRHEIYQEYADRVSNMRVLVMRKRAAIEQ
jgi:ubiquinone/menaquinone biosynthesis C-methylase UbiE